MFPMKRVAVAAGLLAAASSLSPAAATPVVTPIGTPALSIGSTGTEGQSAATRGWSFTLGNEIKVVALGFYDNQLNGLVDSHQVGIWDVSGTLLVPAPSAAAQSARSSVSSAIPRHSAAPPTCCPATTASAASARSTT